MKINVQHLRILKGYRNVKPKTAHNFQTGIKLFKGFIYNRNIDKNVALKKSFSKTTMKDHTIKSNMRFKNHRKFNLEKMKTKSKSIGYGKRTKVGVSYTQRRKSKAGVTYRRLSHPYV